MLRKLFESLTTATGSKLGDARYEASRLSLRATIAYSIGHDDEFAKLGSQAEQIRKLLENPNFDQLSIVIDKLKAMGKELKYLEAAQGLTDQISNACRAGSTDSMKIARNSESTDTEWREMLRFVLIAGDSDHKFWSADEVLAAKGRFGLKGVPSYDALSSHFGKEQVDRACQEIIEERVAWLQFHDELQGNKSPCHECGAAADLTFHDFGLARLLKKERDWKMAGAAVALSVLTVPTLGMGYLRGPDSTQSANVLRMRLVLCKSCGDKRPKGWKYGSNEKECSLHPWWVKAHDAGFDKFIPGSEISAWR
jgi:hypothetical protein